jgi:carboxymethylenebutenolidase
VSAPPDRTGHVDITSTGSRPLYGYVSTPAGQGPWPGVVLVHEAFGLDEVMRRHADRLAGMGLLSLAVDLYSAGGPARCLVSTMRSMLRGQGRAFTDIEAARQHLAGSPQCTGRIGIIGFCMGGGFALLSAGTGFDAASVNYGMLPKDLDAAVAGVCPMVASYGGDDRTLKGAAAELERALTQAGVEHDVKEYPGASHSFLNDAANGPRALRPLLKVSGMGPEPVAAADAWQRIESFFSTHLRENPPL